MQAYTYIAKGKFTLVEKPKPTLIDSTDVSGHQYAGNERNEIKCDNKRAKLRHYAGQQE